MRTYVQKFLSVLRGMRFDERLPRRARKRAYASYGVSFYIAFVRSAGTQKLSHRACCRKVLFHHLFAERRQSYCTRLVPPDISLRFGIDVELYRIRRRHVQVFCNFVPLCAAVLPLQLLYGYKIFKL